jgi:hypothetical protein
MEEQWKREEFRDPRRHDAITRSCQPRLRVWPPSEFSPLQPLVMLELHCAKTIKSDSVL